MDLNKTFSVDKYLTKAVFYFRLDMLIPQTADMSVFPLVCHMIASLIEQENRITVN